MTMESRLPSAHPSLNGDIVSQPLTVAGRASIGIFMSHPEALLQALKAEINELDYTILAYARMV